MVILKVIEIWGIRFYAYGLLIGIGVYLAWEIAKRYGRVEEKVLDKLLPGLIISGVVGARIYHIVDFWEYYAGNLKEIFYVWNGGLGIWGALVGGTIYLSVFAYFNKLNFLKLLDSIIIGVPLGQAIGRLGNWVNGELYGKNGEPLFAWEGTLNLILFGFLLYFSGCRIRSSMTTVENKLSRRNDGLVSGIYLIGYGLIRIYLENFRSDSIIWRIGGIPTAIIFGMMAIIAGGWLIISRRRA